MKRPVFEVLRSAFCADYRPMSVEYSDVTIQVGKGAAAKTVRPLEKEVILSDCGEKKLRSIKAVFPLSAMAPGNTFRFDSWVDADEEMTPDLLSKLR
jgi:hypothetical protein